MATVKAKKGSNTEHMSDDSLSLCQATLWDWDLGEAQESSERSYRFCLCGATCYLLRTSLYCPVTEQLGLKVPEVKPLGAWRGLGWSGGRAVEARYLPCPRMRGTERTTRQLHGEDE